MRRSRWWTGAGAVLLMVGVAGGVTWWRLGQPPPAPTPPTAARYLRTTGAPLVRLDEHAGEVVSVVGKDAPACLRQAGALSGEIGTTDLPALIQALPDARLAEAFLDETALAQAGLAACATHDPSAGGYAAQLDALHRSIHQRLIRERVAGR